MRRSAMIHKTISFLILLLLFVPLSSGAGLVEGFKEGIKTKPSVYKVATGLNLRKILTIQLQDYDDASANPKHDPKKKPGPGHP